MTEAMVTTVAERLARLARAEATVLVAVSGGPDSLALLDLLHLGAPQHRRHLEVVHIDHGIDPNSDAVAAMVCREAERRGLAVRVVALDLGAGTSETKARTARRRALRELLAPHASAVIALGHHADDQLETILLRVFRGSGPVGLAGMAARRGPWIRPLLEMRHAALVSHCAARGMSPWQDPANADPQHLRSWLRTVALPVLRERLPDVDHRLREVGMQAGELRQGLNALPEVIESLALRDEVDGFSVAAPALMGYRSGLRSTLIGALGRRCGVPIGRNRRAAILALLRGGRSGAAVTLTPRLTVEFAFERLHFRSLAGSGLEEVVLPEDGTLQVGRHRLRVTSGRARGSVERIADSTWLARGGYLVRRPVAGDQVEPIGGTGRRSIRVLMREARVPVGRRHGWPVIVSATDPATVVWVPGICRSTVGIPEAGEEALHVACDVT